MSLAKKSRTFQILKPCKVKMNGGCALLFISSGLGAASAFAKTKLLDYEHETPRAAPSSTCKKNRIT